MTILTLPATQTAHRRAHVQFAYPLRHESPNRFVDGIPDEEQELLVDAERDRLAVAARSQLGFASCGVCGRCAILGKRVNGRTTAVAKGTRRTAAGTTRSEEHTSELQ